MLNDLIYKELVPYASYMQIGWICFVHDEEDRPHGLSSEVAIVALTGIVVGSFFQSFFKVFGKLAAQKAFESLMDRIKRSEGHEPCVSELNDLVEKSKGEIKKLYSNRVSAAIDCVKLELSTELQNAGLPERKAVNVANECIKIISKEIFKD